MKYRVRFSELSAAFSVLKVSLKFSKVEKCPGDKRFGGICEIDILCKKWLKNTEFPNLIFLMPSQ